MKQNVGGIWEHGEIRREGAQSRVETLLVCAPNARKLDPAMKKNAPSIKAKCPRTTSPNCEFPVANGAGVTLLTFRRDLGCVDCSWRKPCAQIMRKSHGVGADHTLIAVRLTEINPKGK